MPVVLCDFCFHISVRMRIICGYRTNGGVCAVCLSVVIHTYSQVELTLTRVKYTSPYRANNGRVVYT